MMLPPGEYERIESHARAALCAVDRYRGIYTPFRMIALAGVVYVVRKSIPTSGDAAIHPCLAISCASVLAALFIWRNLLATLRSGPVVDVDDH